MFDLQIHPRDHELIAATHGRSLWIVDIAALEQMTPKVVAQGTYLFTAEDGVPVGRRSAARAPGQRLRPGGDDVRESAVRRGHRLSSRGGGVRGRCGLIVSNAAGDTFATLNGPGAVGVHHVNWNFQQAAPRRAPAEQSPSQRRDSILLARARAAVLDSLTKAGYDTAAIRTVRAQVAQIVNPNAAAAVVDAAVEVAAVAVVVVAAPVVRRASIRRRSGRRSARGRLKRRAVGRRRWRRLGGFGGRLATAACAAAAAPAAARRWPRRSRWTRWPQCAGCDGRRCARSDRPHLVAHRIEPAGSGGWSRRWWWRRRRLGGATTANTGDYLVSSS